MSWSVGSGLWQLLICSRALDPQWPTGYAQNNPSAQRGTPPRCGSAFQQQTLAPGWLAAEAFLFGDVCACQRGWSGPGQAPRLRCAVTRRSGRPVIGVVQQAGRKSHTAPVAPTISFNPQPSTH
ncbi:MAG TPA: hypothetical protein VG713_07930, partial [Pirellulales bacterium]|nr:hypothetical protein [Pirellulales bacterium]